MGPAPASRRPTSSASRQLSANQSLLPPRTSARLQKRVGRSFGGFIRPLPQGNGSAIRIQVTGCQRPAGCQLLRGAATESRLIRTWAMTWSETTRRLAVLTLADSAQQQLDRGARHRGDRLPNGGELRPDGRGRRACRRSRPRTGRAARPDPAGAQPRPRRRPCRRCWRRSRSAGFCGSAAFRSLEARAIGEVALLDQRRIDREPRRGHGSLEAFVAQRARGLVRMARE